MLSHAKNADRNGDEDDDDHYDHHVFSILKPFPVDSITHHKLPFPQLLCSFTIATNHSFEFHPSDSMGDYIDE